MRHDHTFIRLMFAFLTLVLLPTVMIGQTKFTVNGRVKIEGGDIEGSRVVVYKNGVKERTITAGLNKFSLDLEINQNYIMSFEKDGFVAKKISFNTKAPAEAVPNGFTPFDFAVSLFKQYDDINLVVFNQPVGIIHYDSKLGDFDYDTDYTKSIQSQLEEVLAKVEEKQKQEVAAAKEEQLRAVETAKAAAKMEAQAKKDAEAQAKVEEKQKEEARKLEDTRVAEERKTAQKLELEQKEKEAAKAQIAEKPAEKPVEQPKADPKPEPIAPPPAPVAKVKVPTPKPQINTLASKTNAGEDSRRSVPMGMAEEQSPIAMAKVNMQEEERVEEPIEQPELVRNEELLVESNRVTTVVKVTLGDHADEYRKVVHKWGAQYYFKNGIACSQLEYDSAGLGQTEDLAGATPQRNR